MSARIGIGIIGFAHGHASIYCQRMLADDDVRLVACWDDDESRGREAAERYGLRYSPHLEDVLHDPGVQGVIITCETNRHAEVAVAAAAAGKHILCQKPMALTLADCDRMAGAAHKAGVKFMMAYQMRHDPSNIKIKQLVEGGALGRIGLLRRRHCISMLFNADFVNGPTRWHIDPEKNMGMFMDDASHATNFIHWIMGRPMLTPSRKFGTFREGGTTGRAGRYRRRHLQVCQWCAGRAGQLVGCAGRGEHHRSLRRSGGARPEL